MDMLIKRCWLLSFVSCYFLINEDKSHRLNVLRTFISSTSLVSTRVVIIMVSTSTKPDSGVALRAVVLDYVVTKDTNSGHLQR